MRRHLWLVWLTGCAYIGTDGDHETTPADDTGCEASTWYLDLDGDGFGDASASACRAEDGWVSEGGDCDESDPLVNPDAAEICDTRDNDCDALVDTEDPDVTNATVGFSDRDLDGYGSAAVTSCDASEVATVGGDCDDDDESIHPDATEICDGLDDDCDGATDEDFFAYDDADGDGFGDPATGVADCDGSSGRVTNSGDCDDTTDAVHPGATEICDDQQNDCSDEAWDSDAGLVTFFPTMGGDPQDYTDDFAAGTYAAPSVIDLSFEGDLQICAGTWFVGLEITALNIDIRGLGGPGEVILDGADKNRLVGITRFNATVGLSGLTLTHGYACYGTAVSTWNVSYCYDDSSGASGVTGVDLALTDVVITDNASRSETVGLNGATVTFENSEVSSNPGTGVYAYNSTISCTGSTSTTAGFWGNNYGLYLVSYDIDSSYVFDSVSCDFDGLMDNQWGDITVMYSDGPFDYDVFTYGDDATFQCDASTATCG